MNNQYQVLRYLVIGVCTTAIGFGVYLFSIQTLNIEVNTANVISIVFALLFAFFANKIFVYRQFNFHHQVLMKEGITFISARLLALWVEVSGVALLYNGFKFDPVLSKVICAILVIILNYLTSTYWVFKKPTSHK